uniref:Uncharacterized protein n=1 Tax=Anopheles maculatus TaxID=74869 RepID=A0A182T008_9DIPT
MYGRPQLIVNTLMEQIRKTPMPRVEKLDTLVEYGVMVEEINAAVRTSGLALRYDGPLLEELVGRLPPVVAFLWGMQRVGKAPASLGDFSEWMRTAKEAALIASPSSTRTDEKRATKHLNVHVPTEQLRVYGDIGMLVASHVGAV